MSHDHHRLAPRPQVRSQPGDALDVEVVARLVEDEQVVVADQRTRKGDPTTFAAGQRCDDPVEHLVEVRPVTEQPGEDVTNPSICGPFMSRTVAHDQRAHRRGRVEVVDLPDLGHPQAAGVRDATGIGWLPAGQQPEQGRLAVAVAADDTGAVALDDAERDVFEQGAGAVGLADVLDVDQVARHSVSPGHRRRTGRGRLG